MQSLRDNPVFLSDSIRLRSVGLNPSRHTAANAYDHSEMVVQLLILREKRSRLSPGLRPEKMTWKETSNNRIEASRKDFGWRSPG